MRDWTILPYPWSRMGIRGSVSPRPMPVSSLVPASVGCHFCPDEGSNDSVHLANRGKGGYFDQAVPLEALGHLQLGIANPLIAAFPRPRRGFIDGTENQASRETIHFLEAIDTLATSVEEVLSLCDEAPSHDPDGLVRYRQQAYMRIPWNRLAERWLRTETNLDPAPLSLVARLARDHGDQLIALAATPRRLLIRQRREERIDRIQELDPHCLLDFIQRPGRNLAEKAGRNQTLLGVTRRETIDTLENRVLRDLLIMADRRARAYSLENKGVERLRSRRLRKTDSFRRQINSVLSTSPLAQATSLSSDVQPNYALLKDRRYQIVWRYWQEFRREERLRRELWSWSRRFWGDIIRAAIIMGFSIHHGDTSYDVVGNSEALLRRTPLQGRYFLPSCQSIRFRDSSTGSLLDVIHPDHFNLYQDRSITGLLQTSGADLVVTRIRPKEGLVRPNRCLFVYTFLPLSNCELQKEEIIADLTSILASIHEGYRILVIVGASVDPESWGFDNGRLAIVGVNPLMLANFPHVSVSAVTLLNRKILKEDAAI